MLALFACIECNSIGSAPLVELKLAVCQCFLDYVILCSRRIYTVRIEIVCEDNLLEKTLIDGIARILEKKVPENRSSYCTLEYHITQHHVN